MRCGHGRRGLEVPTLPAPLNDRTYSSGEMAGIRQAWERTRRAGPAGRHVSGSLVPAAQPSVGSSGQHGLRTSAACRSGGQVRQIQRATVPGDRHRGLVGDLTGGPLYVCGVLRPSGCAGRMHGRAVPVRGSVVTWRRSQMVRPSMQGIDVAVTAKGRLHRRGPVPRRRRQPPGYRLRAVQDRWIPDLSQTLAKSELRGEMGRMWPGCGSRGGGLPAAALPESAAVPGRQGPMSRGRWRSPLLSPAFGVL
jgi:hypothetical protein